MYHTRVSERGCSASEDNVTNWQNCKLPLQKRVILIDFDQDQGSGWFHPRWSRNEKTVLSNSAGAEIAVAVGQRLDWQSRNWFF